MEKIIIRQLNKANYILVKCRLCKEQIERATSVSSPICFVCRQKNKLKAYHARKKKVKKPKTWRASPSTFKYWVVGQKDKIKFI